MLKGATASRGEVDQLRRIDNVVRLGHVERIDRTAITLEHGSVPTSPDHLHIHCASAGLSDNPPKPIFADDQIVLQPVTRVSLSLSTALIAFVEATGRTTADKNRLCVPNPWPHTPFDWARHLLTGMRTEMEWQSVPDLVAWLEASRLNLVKGLDQDPDHADGRGPARPVPHGAVSRARQARRVRDARLAGRARTDVPTGRVSASSSAETERRNVTSAISRTAWMMVAGSLLLVAVGCSSSSSSARDDAPTTRCRPRPRQRRRPRSGRR